MGILDFMKYKKTNFKGGDLLFEDLPRDISAHYKVDEKFLAPRKIDSRDLCLSSSNQGNTPHCVGYTTAGFIEVFNWKTKHYPEQVDGDAIYAEAKRIDGHPKVKGTWLKYGIQAAKNLGLIAGTGKPFKGDISTKFALHQYGVCLSAFMIDDNWNYVDKKTGMIRSQKGVKKLGGHAVLLVGYNDQGVFIQNSWSAKWGVHGFAILNWDMFKSQFHNGMIIEVD